MPLTSRRLTLAWATLIAVTLLGFIVTEVVPLRVIAVAAIMVITGFKVRLVLYQFMELNTLPTELRRFFNLWLLVCCGIIFGLYWYAL